MILCFIKPVLTELDRSLTSYPSTEILSTNPFLLETNRIVLMRSLVTGAAGFIGSNLVDYLVEQGHTVVCIDNESSDAHDSPQLE